MEQLSPSQQEALEQLQGILGPRNYDVDVLMNVLQSINWNVQVCNCVRARISSLPSDVRLTPPEHATELLVNELDEVEDVGPNSRNPQAVQLENSGLGSYEHSLTRILISLVYFPIGLVSGVLRFVLGILPVTSPFNTNVYRIPRQSYPDPRSATRRWITSVEEETGAVSLKSLKSTRAMATGLESQEPTLRRHTYPPVADDNKILPDFFDGTYEEVLDACQKEGRIVCVVLVSDEHDDVPEFKRSTLTHPGFVRMLSENNFIVWGGDIRDKDPWDAAQKLQATTYPFVAFVALQPRRSHSPNLSSSAPTPVLTILSRHYGPSVPESGPTSAQTLMHYLEHQLLPRVNPFLIRFQSQQQERERDRIIREQQDRAFQESADRDRERIQARIRAEQEETERLRLEDEARRQEEQRMHLEQEKEEGVRALRLQYRRWMRRYIVPTEHQSANGIRLALKLPGNTRVVRTFSPSSTLTELYAFVDTQTLPLDLELENDPEQILEGSGSDVQKLDCYIQSQVDDVDTWWGFRLVLPYPRQEIRWATGVSLVGAGLKSGEQLVVEFTNGSVNSRYTSGDDDYESEDD